MYEDIVKRLRNRRICIQQSGSIDDFPLLKEAADAIEELSKKFVAEHELREKALNRLCGWCGVCTKENRDAVGCDDIAQLGEVHAPRWISVEDRLPMCGQRCLVVMLRDDGKTSIETAYCYVQNYGYWSDTGTRRKVTHWMPLPEPPEREAGE